MFSIVYEINLDRRLKGFNFLFLYMLFVFECEKKIFPKNKFIVKHLKQSQIFFLLRERKSKIKVKNTFSRIMMLYLHIMKHT